MKTKKIWLGMLALAMTFGMMVVGCGDDGGGDSGDSTLTVTNIPPQYNGMYAYFETCIENSDDNLCGFETIDTSLQGGLQGTPVQISNGRVSLPMWKAEWKVDGYSASRYSGNDTTYSPNGFSIFDIQKQSYDQIYLGVFQKAITFSNGSATKSWNDLSSYM
jgi:hypothetical protein